MDIINRPVDDAQSYKIITGAVSSSLNPQAIQLARASSHAHNQNHKTRLCICILNQEMEC